VGSKGWLARQTDTTCKQNIKKMWDYSLTTLRASTACYSDSRSRSYFTTDGQPVFPGVKLTLRLVTRYYFLSEGFCLKVGVLFLWGALSHERVGLQFAVLSLNGPSRAEPVTILYCLI
jgi:hypothetical protein